MEDIKDLILKLTSRVIDKQLTSLKDLLVQDNLNEFVMNIDEHFIDFQTCTDLEDTIFVLESYLNKRGIGGILTGIQDNNEAKDMFEGLRKSLIRNEPVALVQDNKLNVSKEDETNFNNNLLSSLLGSEIEKKKIKQTEILEVSEEYKSTESESDHVARRKGITLQPLPPKPRTFSFKENQSGKLFLSEYTSLL